MDLDRRALRDALRQAAPWLDAPDFGPRAVEAGDCTRCTTHPRLLPTCGPAAPGALCRTCANELADEAWCEGHRDEGRVARRWANDLPDDWSEAVRWWWVATGEISLDQGAWPPTLKGTSIPW